MHRKKFLTVLFLAIAFIITNSGCGLAASDLKTEDVSRYIQNDQEVNTDTHDGFYFELLNYHKQCLYMNNGYTLSKWEYENEAYTCKQTIPLKQLFPQEYQSIDQTIEYIKNDEVNLVSFDGRFISIFDARNPSAFYFWDTEDEALYNIKPLSPIRKIQWADDESLIYMLTEENTLYCLDPVSKNVTESSIKLSIPDVGEQNIRLLKEGIIYYDGLQVLFANGNSKDQVIADNVIEFYGVYKNTLVIKRMDNKVEAGFIEDEWNPFYSERINDCYPVNGQYLRFRITENHDEVELLDLMSGNIASFKTSGYGYEVFPKTNVIMFYDNNGTPYIQRPNETPKLLQLRHAEPYSSNTALITILRHEADDKMSLQLFSLEDHEWLMFKINS